MVKVKQTFLDKGRVFFSHQAEATAKVFVVGSFNDWDPEADPMVYDSATKCFTKELKLKRGEYEYKFVVDGAWTMDNDNPRFTANDFGTLNSIFEI